MTRLIDRLRRPAADQARFGLGDLARWVAEANATGGLLLGGRVGSYRDETVTITSEDRAYSASGVAFAVVGRRIDLFSQVRFAWKRPDAAPRPMASDLFTDAALAPLVNPAELLTWMELDLALAGNSFVARDGGVLRRLVPWWVCIVLTSERFPDQPEHAWDARVLGYRYEPPGGPAEVFFPDEVAHYRNRPDPSARFRGMSYLRPVLANIANTEAMERYLTQFWSKAATPNMVAKMPPELAPEMIDAFADKFNEAHQGLDNAFRTAFLGGGADLTVVGSKLSDLTAKDISASEFGQVCAAAGVPPVVVTMVPGLEATSTFNNYNSALRSFADLTVRPLWAKAVSSLAPLIGPPLAGAGGELWYDPTGISALQQDAKDDAEVAFLEAQTMRQLIDSGYEADSVTLAVTTGDRTKLVHSGLFSVQLQPPGGGQPDETEPSDDDDDGGDSGGQAEDPALTLQRLYLPVNSRVPLLSAEEARAIANRSGAGLTGSAPEEQDPPPSPFGQPALGTGDDPDDPGEGTPPDVDPEPEEDEAA